MIKFVDESVSINYCLLYCTCEVYNNLVLLGKKIRNTFLVK